MFFEEEKPTEEPTIPISTIANCLEVLTQCHATISEQDVSRFHIPFESDEKKEIFFW